MSMLKLSFEAKEVELDVRRFTVHEALSEPFEVSVVARSANEDIDLEAIVGRPAGFMLVGSLGGGRVWTGVVSQAEQIDVEAPGPGAIGLSTYAVKIVPSFWLTKQRRDNRVFQKLTIPKIVAKVLEPYGIEPKLALTETHPEHEYRVQYAETDFAFISRLLEEEGISYLFSQEKGDKGTRSRMTLVDQPTAAESRGAVRWVDHPNEAAGREFVTEVRVGREVRPGKHLIRDFDFTRPGYLLLGEAERAKSEALLEHYLYEHGAFVEETAGKARSDVALQSLRRARRSVALHSNVHGLAPGATFAIDGHPRGDLASGKKLLVIEATHEGTTESEWTVAATAVFAAEPYRPAQITPRPVIHGVQSAVVVGPSKEEIHTDEHGRVRVQFHWDREGKHDDKSSCWVRVSQAWAGTAYGMMAIPRVGQEVLVSFWEGNPDQPIVTGRVYNGKNLVPYKLPDNKTRSTWKSNSSPGSKGFNEILFEDKAGKELVFVHAQKDLSKLVKNDETERTGANRTIIVGDKRSSVVGKTDTTLVGEKLSIVVVKPKDLEIQKLGEPQYSLTETMITMEDGRILLTNGKAHVVLDGKTITLKADGDIQIKAGGEVVIHGGPLVKINC